MGKQADVEASIRYRILGMLHAGRLAPGERLPSIRALSRDEGLDHRMVADAYRALQAEGLVEIRPGSGVYVADAGGSVEGVLAETAAWVAERLVEGWHRRLPRARVGELFDRCASTPLRCACVESNRDHMVALSGELEEDFSLEVVPVPVEDAAGPRTGAEAARLQDVDLVVSTVFHAEPARAAAAEAGLPFVLLTLDADFSLEIDRRLRAGPVTAVVADPKLAERGRTFFAVTRHRDRIRYVLADRAGAEGVDLDAEDVLVTRAARRLLGMEDFHLLPPPMRVISPAAARELYGAIVPAALRRAR